MVGPMKKILIFGDGQIGNFYLEYFSAKDYQVQIAKGVDIRNFDQVAKAINDYRPSTVINTAAMTNLEWCGQHRLEAFDVNVLGAATVAKACDQAGVYLVHFSSGCIFSSRDGKDAKAETDAPNPSSYYGWTKVWSEEMVAFERSEDFKFLILRPRQPVSAQVNHKNMLVKMLTFTKFVDTANSGTVLEDLMDWTDQLIDKQVTGILHVANSGWTTPYQIALMIKESILPALEPAKITKAELDKMTPNTRVDTVLDVTRLEELGIKVKPYKQRLAETVKQLGDNIRSMDRAELKQQLEETAAASRQRTVLNSVYELLYR
ncbi:sugar nucleotide-binding protein [Candidatus Saccharibacteria bacterium]|nr:sugar nucleotide-binding protein [Candidatus Saccharibacteria bacterium]